MFDWRLIGNLVACALLAGAVPSLISFNVNPTGGWRTHLAAGAGGIATYLTGRFQQSPMPPKPVELPK